MILNTAFKIIFSFVMHKWILVTCAFKPFLAQTEKIIARINTVFLMQFYNGRDFTE